MTRTTLAFAALVLAAPAAAQTLDTRAASQRACLERAQAAGYQVTAIANPIPLIARLAEVVAERVRLQLADGRILTCIYEIDEAQARLERL